MQLKTPTYLQKNDQVALLAPAGFLEDEKPVIIAEQLLSSWGLIAKRGQFVLKQDGYFAGTDEQRLEDFQKALDNPKIKAIWMLRGGYGTMRILSKLSFEKFKQNPKWIVGFSDITAVHNLVHNLGFKSMHALMPVQLSKGAKDSEIAIDSLHKALFGEIIEYIIPVSECNQMGKASGVLVGGNLTMLQSLLGSPDQIKTKGKIVFIEEVSEYMYRIDRLLQSLQSAGFFKDIKGLIVGDFTDIKENGVAYNKTYQELIIEVVKDFSIPVLFNFPAGHISDNRALIFGSNLEMNVGEFVSSIRTN